MLGSNDAILFAEGGMDTKPEVLIGLREEYSLPAYITRLATREGILSSTQFERLLLSKECAKGCTSWRPCPRCVDADNIRQCFNGGSPGVRLLPAQGDR